MAKKNNSYLYEIHTEIFIDETDVGIGFKITWVGGSVRGRPHRAVHHWELLRPGQEWIPFKANFIDYLQVSSKKQTKHYPHVPQ